MGIVHWDDIERHRAAKGEMDATWQQLAKPAGAVGIGVNRMRVAPGKLPTPPHSHGASEEIYYVLGGAGLAWQDEQVHEVRAGDCVIHRADEMEHTFIAGPDGLDCLVFGTRHPTEFGWLPRSGAVRIGWPWIEGRVDDPWDVEAEGPPLEVGDPAARPPNIINIDEAERDVTQRRDTALLATDERSVLAGFYWERLFPGAIGAPPHCHSEEEEAFVMLDGDGTLGLWPSPRAASSGSVREDVPIRPGHVVVRPPGTPHRALLPGRAERPDDADLRHPQAQRHVLVSAIEQDLVARPGRDRPHRIARLLRRRARRRRGARMKLGLHVARFTYPGGPPTLADDLRRIVIAGEAAGYDRISVMDHVWQIHVNGPPEQEMLEPYTALGYMAALTSRVQLLTLVTGVVYRPPGLLAKMVTTLDVLSQGRAMLGIGAAWNEEESLGLALPFPPISERFERLEETLQICLQMWSDSEQPYHGRHYQLARTLNSPQSLRRPHPPILIGGGGERKTLRLVARYAQSCNLFAGPELAHKLDVLRGHCETEGRDYDEIEKTVSYRMDVGKHGERVAQTIEELGELSELGIDVAHGQLADMHEITPIEIVASEVLPAAANL